jgi:hypothetical protein
MQVQAEKTNQYISYGIFKAAKRLKTAHDGTLHMGFKRDSMAYEFLLGTIHMRHKSMQHYTHLIKHTLEEDYGIPVELNTVTPERDSKGGHRARAAKEISMELSARAQKLRFPAYAKVLDKQEMRRLKAWIIDGRGMVTVEDDDDDRQKLHVYAMVCERYQVSPERCDEAFFNTYVKTVVKEEAEMVQLYYALLRLHEVRRLSVDELRAAYNTKLRQLLSGDQSAITMYQARHHQFYKPAIDCIELLDKLAPQWRANMREAKVRWTPCSCDPAPSRFT